MSVHMPSHDPELTASPEHARTTRWILASALSFALATLWLFRISWWFSAALVAGLTIGSIPTVLVRYRHGPGLNWPTWSRLRRRRTYVVPLDVPPTPRNFVGRSQDIEKMRSFLSSASTGPRIISITGSAGIGKTALATRFSFLVENLFPDGQLFSFVNQPVKNDDGVNRTLESFIKALQPTQRPVPGTLEARARRYARLTRNRKVIVVLDDVDGVDASALRKLFPAGPDCAVVLTSRLPVPGVNALSVPLGALSYSDSVNLLQSVVGDKRVAGEPQAARRIVSRSSRYPLSLRLAGTSLAARPHLALKLAADRMPDAPADEGGAERGTLDLSFALLTDDERRAFRCLGLLTDRVFAPWMLAALMGADEEKATRLADSLSFVGLVQRTTNDESGLVRFRVHDHVLAYARAVRDREMPPQEQGERRHALFAAHRERESRDLAALLSDRIPWLEEAGRLAEAANLARDVLGQTREPDGARPTEQAMALASLAGLQVELGNTQVALEFVAKAKEASPDAPVPRALRVEGKALRRLRKIDEAQRVLNSALYALGARDTAERIRVLRELSAAIALGPVPDQALPPALEAARLCQSDPAFGHLAPSVLWAEANALFRAGRSSEAAARLEKAEDAALRVEGEQDEPEGQLLWKAWVAELRAEIAAALRDQEAETFAATAIARFTEARHRYGIAYCQLVLGRFYELDDGRLDEAEALLTEALRNFQSCEDPWIVAETTRVLGVVRLRRGDDEAKALLDVSWQEFRRLRDGAQANKVGQLLADIATRSVKTVSDERPAVMER